MAIVRASVGLWLEICFNRLYTEDNFMGHTSQILIYGALVGLLVGLIISAESLLSYIAGLGF